MPSSISSSELQRAPPGHWLRVVLVGALLAASGLTSLELFWRWHGHRPAVNDNRELWAWWRSRVHDAGVIVLMGSSRVQVDVSTREMRRRLPGRRIVQLALDGSYPVAVLRDLAADDGFAGTVIVEIAESGLSRAGWESQREYVAHYHKGSVLERRLNARMAAALQDQLALLNPSIALVKALGNWQIPRPWYLRTHPDRSRAARYALTDLPRLRAEREALMSQTYRDFRSPAPAVWLAEALAVDSLARTITARGGHVAFVVFPATGLSWELTERVYPKAQYWDRFAATAASVTLHFRDVPSLAGFDCPDTSHLDAADTPRFTAALIRELAGRGVW